jgi:hypothetical protein
MGYYLAKMDLVEDDLIRMADPPESCHEGQYCNDCDCNPVIPFHALGLNHHTGLH